MKIVITNDDAVITDDSSTTDFYVTDESMCKILNSAKLRRAIFNEFDKSIVVESIGEEIQPGVFKNNVFFKDEEINDSKEVGTFGFYEKEEI